MRDVDNFIAIIDYILNTPRKRHITGGILLSASLLFVGLALTVITLKHSAGTDEEEPPSISGDYSDYARHYHDSDEY